MPVPFIAFVPACAICLRAVPRQRRFPFSVIPGDIAAPLHKVQRHRLFPKMSKGLAIIISGPSGAGKSSVINAVRPSWPSMRFSISEDVDERRCVHSAGNGIADLPGALHIDVQYEDFSGVDGRENRTPGRAVAVVMDYGMLQKLPAVACFGELSGGAEVVPPYRERGCNPASAAQRRHGK